MELDLVGRGAGDLGRDELIEIRHLMPGPDLQRAIGHAGHGVQGLEGCMREIGEGEACLQDLVGRCQGRSRIAVIARHRQRRCLGLRLVGRKDIGRAALFGLVLVPGYGHQVPGLERRPHGLGHHRDTAGDLNRLHEPLHVLCLGRVERRDRRTELRRMDHDGCCHLGQLHVDGELGGAIGLHARVVALQIRIADLGPGTARLERNISGTGSAEALATMSP